MGIEIERKFLVTDDGWRSENRVRIQQGYLVADEGCSIRVRISGDKALLTLKGPTHGTRRSEFEYEIPPADGFAMLEELAIAPCIDKWRTTCKHAGHLWEVDEFLGQNEGLVVAEIELESEDEAFERPVWLGEEVSTDPRYFNASLTKHSYAEWKSD